MSAESELLERRKAAIQKGVPRYIQLKKEEAAAQAKVKAAKDRTKALLAGLENHNIGKSAFLEALKRAQQDQDELQLFDSETMELEDWIRISLAGDQLVEDDSSAEIEIDGDDNETGGEPAGDGGSVIEGAGGGEDLAGDDTLASAFEEDVEPPHVAHARKVDEQLEADAAARKANRKSRGNVVNLAPPDPAAATKIQSAQADAGSEGLSAADIPMPKTSLHDQAPTGFVERNEHISAADYNEQVRAKG